jgi:Ni/Fe-hydrogenase subunit HybB-like protein
VLAIGGAALLSAIAIEVSYTQAPSGLSKSKIAIPLFIAGGIGIGAGLAVFLTSGTTIEPDGPKPDRRSAFVGVSSRW